MDFSSKENFRFFVYFSLKNRKSLILQGNIYVLLCSCERRKIMVTKILDGQNALDFCLKNDLDEREVVIIKYNLDTKRSWYSVDYENFFKINFDDIKKYI